MLTLAAKTSHASPPQASIAGMEFDGTALLRRLLDEIDYGLLLIDHGGSVVLANRAARIECADGRALRISGDRIAAGRDRDASALAVALGDAARGKRSLLRIGSGDETIALAAVPVPLGPNSSATLLILGKRHLCETLSVDLFARRHGLTGAESHVLQALCAGTPPTEIAADFGVSLATVRTQVASIRSKTESTSIRDLVRKVAALPPIVPALRDVTLQ